MTTLPRLISILFALLVASCGQQNAEPVAGPTELAPRTSASTQPSAGTSPVEALNAMDTRRPVPLQPMMAWHQKQNMQAHLVAIQQITEGLSREDWEAVAKASSAIESSPQMQQMCQHMGAGAEGFTDLALEFHHRADAIGVAARAHDTVAVLKATSDTLQVCTSCHSTFRQDVVDAQTWQARTGSAQPAMMHKN